MSQSVVVSGRLNAEGGLELDEQIPLPAGPVRVSIEPLSGSSPAENAGGFLWLSEDELKRRKADMADCIGCLSDEEAQAILDVIEQEFEQVNLDEWR